MPLNQTTLDKHAVYLMFYDELFINFASKLAKANIFDQNRASLSLGYYFTKELNASVGYLNQYIEKSDGTRFEDNHGMLVMLTYNPDLRPYFKKH